MGRLSGVGALWDCVSQVLWLSCGGGGGCGGGGVPLGAVLVLSWYGEVSFGAGIQSCAATHHHAARSTQRRRRSHFHLANSIRPRLREPRCTYVDVVRAPPRRQEYCDEDEAAGVVTVLRQWN